MNILAISSNSCRFLVYDVSQPTQITQKVELDTAWHANLKTAICMLFHVASGSAIVAMAGENCVRGQSAAYEKQLPGNET